MVDKKDFSMLNYNCLGKKMVDRTGGAVMDLKQMCCKIRGKRHEKNKTQKDVAEMLGISTRAYNYKENNKSNFTIDELVKIASYLNCSIADFF